MSSRRRRDHRVRGSIGRVRVDVGDVLAAGRETQLGVGIEPVDDAARERRVEVERGEQPLELLARELILLAVRADEIVQVEPCLQILEPAYDRAAVDGQRRQLDSPRLAQVIAIGRVDEILAQDVGRPRFGALHVHQALIGRQRGLGAPQVERALPHEVHGDHRADRDDEHRGDQARRRVVR